MSRLSKQLGIIVAVNVVLILLFVLAEYGIGNELNSYPNDLHYIRWSPFLIQDNHAGAFVNGNWVAVGAIYLTINFPFWLFFASTAINLIFIVKLLRDKEKQNPPRQQ